MKKSTPLFIGKNNEIVNTDQVLSCLLGLGVKKGDNIMIHSDLSVLGRLCLSGNNAGNRFLSALVNVFKKAVGVKGTIIMPTFSYSFLKGETYDVKNSPSTAGILTEFFRKQKGVVRTQNPDLSFAVWGNNKRYFTEHLGKSSFGKGSVFDRFNKKGGKIILFGPFFGGKATFMHHIEEMCGVSYRYKKIINGFILDKGKRTRWQNEHNTRMPGRQIAVDGRKFIASIRKKGILKETYLGDKLIQAVDVRKYFKEGENFLRKSETSFLDKSYFNTKNDFHALEDKLHTLNLFPVPRKERNKDAEELMISEFKKNGLTNFAEKVKTAEIGVHRFITIIHTGLDAGEILIVCGDKENGYHFASVLVNIAKLIFDLPVQLKYSYRFVIGKEAESLPLDKFKEIFPQTKLVFSLEIDKTKEHRERELVLSRLIDNIFKAERDGIFLKQKFSYRPRLNSIGFDEWIERVRMKNGLKKAAVLIRRNSNGRRSLAEISQKEKIEFKEIAKAADILLEAGFLTEIANAF
jgi:aminoglycoside 3-N-acetyltransferase